MKRVFSFNKQKQRGAALAMVLLAATAVAVLATLIIRLSSEQAKNQLQLTSKVAADDLIVDIKKILLDVESCSKSFSALNVTNNGSVIYPIGQLKNRKNEPVYSVGTKYGNHAVLLEKMELTDVSFNPAVIPVTGISIASSKLTVTFNRSRSAILKLGSKAEAIPINLEIVRVNPADGATGRVEKCYATVDSSVDTGVQKFCESISDSGSFNLLTRLCNLLAPVVTTNKDSSALSSAYLRNRMGDFENTYVNSEGDVMTGALENSADINMNTLYANDYVCVNSFCHDFNASLCSNTQMTAAVTNQGYLKCSIDNCPSNYYLQGITYSGNGNCLPFPNKACGVGEYVMDIQASGVLCAKVPSPTAVACGVGDYLQGITATSAPVCKTMMVDTNTNMFNKSCGGYFLRGATSAGVAICTQPCPCGACGSTRAIAASCPANYGTPVNGVDTCVPSGWVRTSNPSCYCPCGTCGATTSIPASCTTGNPVSGTMECRTTGWVTISNPWCQCAGCTCNATRTISSASGTSVIYQICRTPGWVNY